MRKLLAVLMLITIVLGTIASGVSARKVKRETSRVIPTTTSRHGDERSDLPLGYERPKPSAARSTIILGEFTFDNGGIADPQGWTSVDRTQQDLYFHVDDFLEVGPGSFGRLVPLHGNQSLWCGAGPGGEHCSYAILPGYGNGWIQYFESDSLTVTGDVTVSFLISWDCEPGYDYGYFEYEDVSTGWTELASYNGVGWPSTSESFVIAASQIGDAVRFRFRFESDGAWSDEDGLWDTDGALIIDSLLVTDGGGLVDYQDFEGESVGDLATLDGRWQANTREAYGDFADLYPGAAVVQEDPCVSNLTNLWGFFDDPANNNYGCGGYPAQGAVPYGNAMDLYILNEIWSPAMEFTGSGGQVDLSFDVYRDLALDKLVFYVWHVRSQVGGCWRGWRDRDLVYYGGGKDWLTKTEPIGDLIEAGADSIQVALGVVDMCRLWCGLVGTGACHSHAPLFDNVRITRTATTGPLWTVRDIDLFQDNFSTDGSTTGTVRADMAADILDYRSPFIRPGDSVVVSTYERNVGLAQDTYAGFGAAVYAHVTVRTSGPPPVGSSLTDDGFRWPVVASATGADGATWYQIRMDTVFGEYYGPRTEPIANKFCIDLNDNLFTPGDSVFFYFSARDMSSITTYWSQFTGTTTSEAEVQLLPMEMTCLPANATDILYVDDFDQEGAQPYFDAAFEALGITPDRYDVRGPRSAAGNGLGSRANVWQLAPLYRTIIWNSGDVETGTLGTGDRAGWYKSPDFVLLTQFLDLQPAGAGVYLSGDNLAEEWEQLVADGATSASALQSLFMDFDLVASDHRTLAIPASPLAVGQGGSIFEDGSSVEDSLTVYGWCPSVNDFDVLQSGGAPTVAAAYSDNPAHGAVLTQETTNGAGGTARVALSGFSYHWIRDVDPSMPAHIEHLLRILSWFGFTGGATPVCRVEPTALDFGNLATGDYLDKPFVITNIGGAPLTVNVSASCSHYSIESGGSHTLNPTESWPVTVRFQPATAGTLTCLVETGDIMCGDVSCTGVGVPRSTWYVDLANVSGPWYGSPADPFRYVAAAYAAAADGDTIIIRAGTYTENITMTKQLRIESEGGVVRIGSP